MYHAFVATWKILEISECSGVTRVFGAQGHKQFSVHSPFESYYANSLIFGEIYCHGCAAVPTLHCYYFHYCATL